MKLIDLYVKISYNSKQTKSFWLNKKGNGLSISFWENRKLRCIQEWRNSKKNGRRIWYNEKGFNISIKEYVNNKAHGSEKRYSPLHGNRWLLQKWKNGVKHGLEVFHYLGEGIGYITVWENGENSLDIGRGWIDG
ncbi:MAG: hypothetical protein MI867_15645 [Pseudomonadales bacterium]|nr:hypothetical protein [Pseudomonadales bacterium]